MDAGSLTIGQFSRISMSNGRVFQFKFDAMAGQHLKLSAVSANFHVAMDTLLIILSSDGTPLAANNDHNSAVDSSAIIEDFEVTEAGTYTLVVTHANDLGKGSVKVLIEAIAPHTP